MKTAIVCFGAVLGSAARWRTMYFPSPRTRKYMVLGRRGSLIQVVPGDEDAVRLAVGYGALALRHSPSFVRRLEIGELRVLR